MGLCCQGWACRMMRSLTPMRCLWPRNKRLCSAQGLEGQSCNPAVREAAWLWKWDSGCLRWDPLSSWAPAQPISNSELDEAGANFLLFSNCEGALQPPGNVLGLHNFLNSRGKPSTPRCSKRRERGTSCQPPNASNTKVGRLLTLLKCLQGGMA